MILEAIGRLRSLARLVSFCQRIKSLWSPTQAQECAFWSDIAQSTAIVALVLGMVHTLLFKRLFDILRVRREKC